MALPAVIETLRICHGEGEANGCSDHPEEAERPKLLDKEDAPDERRTIGAHPEYFRVSLAHCVASLSLLGLDITCHGSSLLVLPALVTLVDHDLVAELVDVAVPSQVHEEAACHVFDSPEVHGSEDHHDDESEDLLINHRVQEEEAENCQSFEQKVEQAGDWVDCGGEKCVD